MASTRNKNMAGDYILEQKSHSNYCEYSTNESSGYGHPDVSHFAGDGLLNGHMPAMSLANNACDIESYLRGIGSTNLVNPMTTFVPSVKPLQSLNIINRLPVLIPEPLAIEKDQRPYPMR